LVYFSSLLSFDSSSLRALFAPLEMHKLWSSRGKLFGALKDLNVDYAPQTRESRFVKVPRLKFCNIDSAVIY